MMKHFLRIISITLLLAMMLSCVASCGLLDGVNTDTGSSDISSIVESILTGSGSSSDSGWLYPDDELETDPDNPTIPPILFPDEEEDTGTKPPVLVPDEDNTDSGDDNTGSGDNNTGSGDNNTGSGDNNTGSGDDNTGSGDNNTGSGDDNTGSGDNNTGSGDDNTGSGDNNTGSGDDNTGSGDNNTGSGDDNTGSGDNNTGSGDDNTGSGDDNTGSGNDNTGSGDDNTGTGDDNVDEEESGSVIINTGVSYDPYDYIGDVEAFVYGLLINELEALYHIYPSFVQLSNGDLVYGLMYTTFEEQCYAEDEPDVVYVSSGFLPFPKEPEISQEEFDTGLFICNLEYDDDNTVFVWDYRSERFANHCVVFDLYLIYGVDDNGCIFYQARDYVRGYCDESLGNLYSYDEGREVFVNEVEEYVPVTASPIAELVDFKAIEDEINANIEAQAAAFASFDIESAIYVAQNGVIDYLLGLQEETIMGVPLNDLLQATRDLDPMTCFRITDEGIKVIDITEPPPPQADNTSKWIVGSVCAVVAVAAMVGEQFAMAVPGLPALTGAVSGAAIEIFMQVVIDGTAFTSVDWRKVVVSSAVGAVSGLASQITFGIVNNNLKNMTEFAKGAVRVAIEAGVDSILGATEQTIIAAIEGQRGLDLLKTFGISAAISAGLSIGLNVVGDLISAGIEKIAIKVQAKKTVQAAVKTVAKKSKRVAKEVGEEVGEEATKKATKTSISDLVNKLFKKIDESDNAYVKWLSNARMSKKLAENSTEKFQKELTVQTNKLINKLTNNSKLDDTLLEGFVDAVGNRMTVKQLREAAENAIEGQLVTTLKVTANRNGKLIDYVIPVNKINGTLSGIPLGVPHIKLDPSEIATGHNRLPQNLINGSNKYFDMLKKGEVVAPDWMQDIIKKKFPGGTIEDAIAQIGNDKSFRTMLEEAGACISWDDVGGRVIFYPDKFTKETIDNIFNEPPAELRDRMAKALAKDIGDQGLDGKLTSISKDELKNRLLKVKNGTVGYVDQVIDGKTYRFKVIAVNTLPEIDFGEYGMKLMIEGGLGLTREQNFLLGARSLKRFVADGGILEDDFVNELLEKFPNYKTAKEVLDALDEKQIVDFVKGSKYVFHESLDGNIYLVKRMFHDKVNGFDGIAHPGWIAVVNQLKAYSGSRYISDHIFAAQNGATYIASSLGKAS